MPSRKGKKPGRKLTRKQPNRVLNNLETLSNEETQNRLMEYEMANSEHPLAQREFENNNGLEELRQNEAYEERERRRQEREIRRQERERRRQLLENNNNNNMYDTTSRNQTAPKKKKIFWVSSHGALTSFQEFQIFIEHNQKEYYERTNMLQFHENVSLLSTGGVGVSGDENLPDVIYDLIYNKGIMHILEYMSSIENQHEANLFTNYIFHLIKNYKVRYYYVFKPQQYVSGEKIPPLTFKYYHAAAKNTFTNIGCYFYPYNQITLKDRPLTKCDRTQNFIPDGITEEQRDIEEYEINGVFDLTELPDNKGNYVYNNYKIIIPCFLKQMEEAVTSKNIDELIRGTLLIPNQETLNKLENNPNIDMDLFSNSIYYNVILYFHIKMKHVEGRIDENLYLLDLGTIIRYIIVEETLFIQEEIMVVENNCKSFSDISGNEPDTGIGSKITYQGKEMTFNEFEHTTNFDYRQHLKATRALSTNSQEGHYRNHLKDPNMYISNIDIVKMQHCGYKSLEEVEEVLEERQDLKQNNTSIELENEIRELLELKDIFENYEREKEEAVMDLEESISRFVLSEIGISSIEELKELYLKNKQDVLNLIKTEVIAYENEKLDYKLIKEVSGNLRNYMKYEKRYQELLSLIE